MTEKKTTLPSLRNQDRKKVKVTTEKVYKLLTNILIGNITELNELVYAGVKLDCDKNQCSLKEPEQKYKTLIGN